jgi:hypothetical protein
MHSAYGRGSHFSVIAGVPHKSLSQRSYYPLTADYLRLHRQQRKVEMMFMTRDVIFDNKFPEAARVNGVFRLSPAQRRDYHYNELMPALRKKTILSQRIQRQQRINAEAINSAQKSKQEDPRAFLGSPDSDAYFLPSSTSSKSSSSQSTTATVYNNFPNFWQHSSRKQAVVPKLRWERHPELGDITRVHETVQQYSSHY